MKYYTKKYKYTKFPDSKLNQVLNLITHTYKQGNLYLTLSKDNVITNYKDLDTFFNDYTQNNFITNIEYLIHGIQKINITFNMYHTEVFMLYDATCNSHIIFALLDTYNSNRL